MIPPVAQLDNATDSDSGDRGFESLRAGHLRRAILIQCISTARLSIYAVFLRVAGSTHSKNKHNIALFAEDLTSLANRAFSFFGIRGRYM